MCGLFGWQWSKQPDRNTCRILAFELAKSMDVRGGQAWGVWSKRLVHRGLGPAAPHHTLYMMHDSMFGHSRYATHGKNIIENTHPFIGGGISLSHNGVISNHSALNRQFNRNHAVDSQHLLSHLVEGKPFTDIEAYGAITWARDKDEDCIYMGLLSSSGSFHAVKTKNGVVWASTRQAVEGACRAAGLEIEYDYQLEPGKVYFAADGLLYVDNKHKSILVSQPVVVQHWSSFSNSYTTRWCNKHKKRYSGCPCRGSHPWIVNVLTADIKGEGVEMAEYVPPKRTPPRYSGGPSGGYTGGPMQPFCARALCMERQTPKGILCAAHQAESDATTKAGSSSARGVPPFCRAAHCFEPRKNWEALYCVHHDVAGDPASEPQLPIQLTQVAEVAATPERSKMVNDMRAAWAGEEPPNQRQRDQMKCDLAQWWLEDNCGANDEALAGMTPTEVLALAEELGFDAEQAASEALTPEEKAPNANPEPPSTKSEAGVQQSQAKHEPTDGCSIAALVYGAGD